MKLQVVSLGLARLRTGTGSADFQQHLAALAWSAGIISGGCHEQADVTMFPGKVQSYNDFDLDT